MECILEALQILSGIRSRILKESLQTPYRFPIDSLSSLYNSFETPPRTRIGFIKESLQKFIQHPIEHVKNSSSIPYRFPIEFPLGILVESPWNPLWTLCGIPIEFPIESLKNPCRILVEVFIESIQNLYRNLENAKQDPSRIPVEFLI